jgi:hypothetical protein
MCCFPGAKHADLVQVRQQLPQAYAAWSDKAPRDTASPSGEAVTVWLAWERRLLETPEWPAEPRNVLHGAWLHMVGVTLVPHLVDHSSQ